MKSLLDKYKEDDGRQPIGGWCGGNYFCTCDSCGWTYGGDKRSYECADCAYDRVERERNNPIIDFSI